MSSTFDTMQEALAFLHDKIGHDDLQVNDVLNYLTEIVSALHDYSHRHEDVLNRGSVVSNEPDLLRIALRHPDDEERHKMLKARISCS